MAAAGGAAGCGCVRALTAAHHGRLGKAARRRRYCLCFVIMHAGVRLYPHRICKVHICAGVDINFGTPRITRKMQRPAVPVSHKIQVPHQRSPNTFLTRTARRSRQAVLLFALVLLRAGQASPSSHVVMSPVCRRREAAAPGSARRALHVYGISDAGGRRRQLEGAHGDVCHPDADSEGGVGSTGRPRP